MSSAGSWRRPAPLRRRDALAFNLLSSGGQCASNRGRVLSPTVAGPARRNLPVPAFASMGRSPSTKPRILVIDDNQDVLNLLRDELTAEGYEVETALDGLAGLRSLKRSKPDLVIIDIMMPNISGPAVMTLIGEKDHYRELRDIPMLIISAQSNIEYVREEGLSLTEWDYLAKPIDFDRLHLLVQRKLALRAPETPPRPDVAHLASA
ncbi:MAG: hypothetical protein CFK52_01330 [Chloracidobacterium sp. CP2_5A]|nr:MAG: hypothetical protein CFK52_01330 [Chloracidobacterium sp. CP2_5A]